MAATKTQKARVDEATVTTAGALAAPADAGLWRGLRRYLTVVTMGLLVTAIVLACVLAVIPAARYALQDRPLKPFVTSPRMPLGDTAVSDVWLADSTADHEDYSNGLRIEKQWAIRHQPRTEYRAFEVNDPGQAKFEWRSGFAGIVFHTTESQIAPFRADSVDQLRVNVRGVLGEVQRKRAYHYLIDRVGRVWRVVEESDIAWHAGRSVWADNSALYVDLNDSFLGVSFEAQTHAKDQPVATPAQLRAARGLVEMLRSKYKIPAANCITHAQVSVNMWSMRIGYHTDWAADFPYETVGLPDNYKIPTPALWAFGFEYDKVFVDVMENRLWPGLGLANQHLERQAKRSGNSTAQIRKSLQDRYRTIFQTLETDGKDGHAVAMSGSVPPPQPAPRPTVPSAPAPSATGGN